METNSRIQAGISDSPVLVGGYPRSGTSLLSAMLACAPDHVQGFELHVRKPSFVAGLDGRYTRNLFDALGLAPEEYAAALAKADVKAMNAGAWTGPLDLVTGEGATGRETTRFSSEFSARAALVEALMQRLTQAGNAKSWGFKILGDMRHADVYAGAWPRARFVIIHRDPADCLPSVLEHLLPDLDVTTQNLRLLAEDWCATVRQWDQWKASMNLKYLEIRYEDLISSPRATLDALSGFLDLNLDSALEYHSRERVLGHVERFSHLSGLKHPLSSGYVGTRRRRLGAEEKRVIHEACGSVMQSLGYVD